MKRTIVSLEVKVGKNKVRTIQEEVSDAPRSILASALDSLFSRSAIGTGKNKVTVSWKFIDEDDADCNVDGTIKSEIYRSSRTYPLADEIVGEIIAGINDGHEKMMQRSAEDYIEEMKESIETDPDLSEEKRERTLSSISELQELMNKLTSL